MVIWITSIMIVYGTAGVLIGMRCFISLLNVAYDEGVTAGQKIEFDRVINRITHATWMFRREQDGMYIHCKFVSDMGEIPIPGPVDFEDGDFIHIQRRLPHHPRCPFYLLGFEAYLSVSVYRPLVEEYDDDS